MYKNRFFVPMLLMFALLCACNNTPSRNNDLDDDNLYVEEGEIDEEVELYGENSLQTGAKPYASLYGRNIACYDYCSELTVRTPFDCDAVVIVKQFDKVVAHAYIQRGSSYTFSLPDGTYQPFFYMGLGWNPYKEMTDGVTGGFVIDESFSKDYPQTLESCRLTYELIQQRNGNFDSKPSSPDEMF